MKIDSIKKRFMMMFAFGFTLAALVASLGIYGMIRGHKEYEDFIREAESVIWFIHHLKEDIRDTRVDLLTMLVDKDPARRGDYKDKISDRDGDINTDFELMIGSELLKDKDDVRRTLLEAKAMWELFREVRHSRLIPMLMAGKDEEARNMLKGVQKERYQHIVMRLGEAYSLTEKVIKEKHETVRASKIKVIYTVVFLMSLGFVTGAVIFYRNSANILLRIAALREAAKRVSDGDLASRVEIEEEDELASLGEAFNRMADWIQEDMDTMLRSERELQEKNVRLNEAMVEAQQHAKIIEFAAKERERQNKKLVDMQSQLLQSEKMASVGQLAAGVAHEINNPVGYINGNMSTLQSYIVDIVELIKRYEEILAGCGPLGCERAKDISEEMRLFKEERDIEFVIEDLFKLLAESKEGLERVTTIVKDLKHFSHVDEAELREFDINKGIESTLNVAWNEIKYKAEVRRSYSELPAVLCYPQQLNQVFMNIIVNAAHAISDDKGKDGTGKGLIGIRTYERDDNVFIEISDNGCGIPEDKIERIFDPFFTTKPVGKGTGLGLSMAYSIIQKHKGEISVRSKVGEGTTFIIKLPIRADMKKDATSKEDTVSGMGI